MNSAPDDEVVDVAVVGAGFAGMYALYRLCAMDMTVQAFEAAADVGGTWWWNCYPGSRCDVESLDYCYAFDEALLDEWKWSERFATQPEVLRYARHVADRYGLRDHITFDARVDSCTWDEAKCLWTVTTEAGQVARARFLIAATGCLSKPHRPDLPGLDDFAGDVLFTQAWPQEGFDLVGKRVGVIGTGSSGIQSIPVIAQEAAHLTVFQRTANFTLPAVNRPIFPEYEAEIRADYLGHRRQILQNKAATVKQTIAESAFDLSDEEREAAYEAKWQRGGAGGIPVLFADSLTNPASNEAAAEFVRRKIRQIVQDPEIAEALTPRDHPIATKRICLDTDYYATFNRDNVTLVDLKKTPIESVSHGAIHTCAGDHLLDVLVFATGFDAMTGPLRAMNVRGIDGQSIEEVWADGPRTWLGLMIAGFPNLFTINGPGSPSVIVNMIAAIEQHVNWIAELIGHMCETGQTRVEPQEEAQDDWVEEVRRVAETTLYPLANSWYNGDNIAGKPRMFMAWLGGYPAYAQRCEEIAAADYAGLEFSA